MRFDTQLIHGGEPESRIEGAVSLPVFQSSTFEYTGQDDYHSLKYIRLNNTPNHDVLHRKLAMLENSEDALVTASGMAAISTTLLTLLSNGDHLLVQDTLYGGTLTLLNEELSRHGISYDILTGDLASWKNLVRPTTKAVYVESISNPLLQVVDLEAVIALSREHGLISMIDNTFASPVNFRPVELGFDLSLHSCSKYLNGHSDIVAGAIIGNHSLVGKIRHTLNHLGGSLDPHACFLLHRGLKTLSLRVRRQNENALQIARFLNDHSAVSRVNYPGLPTDPSHERANRLFDGFGGMLSFELHTGADGAENLMNKLQLPISAPSLGGVETLITRPVTTSHSGLSAEELDRQGISDGLIRLSVGIEAVEDIITDLKQGLAA